MRYNQAEKREIIRLVEASELGVNRTLKEMGIHKSTFYNWYARYLAGGYAGLAPRRRAARSQWNRIPESYRQKVVELALDNPEMSSRQLAFHIVDNCGWYICETSVRNILKAAGLLTSPAYVLISASEEFKDKTTRVNQMWQTDFTYLKVIGWGWYYLSTILDDYSRYIIAWELCRNMKAADAERTIEKALQATGLDRDHAPRVLSDNGSCYVSGDMGEYFDRKGITHVRGAVRHPQTQGKIERWHRSMKNLIKLEHYYSPGELRENLGRFVDYYNNQRYHESLDNLTPADVFCGRDKQILKQRELTKIKTMKNRRKLHREMMSQL